jgi:phosphoserine phosphatase
MGGVAAFFDLDRTLIARSSALALAGAFRGQGLLSRRELAQASLWQVLFTLRGASSREAERMAARGLLRLRGLTREQLQELFEAAVEPRLKPLAYRQALDLAEQHRRRGERTYLASASLAELVRLLGRRRLPRVASVTTRRLRRRLRLRGLAKRLDERSAATKTAPLARHSPSRCAPQGRCDQRRREQALGVVISCGKATSTTLSRLVGRLEQPCQMSGLRAARCRRNRPKIPLR